MDDPAGAAGAVREWARDSGWQYDPDEAGAASARWEDDTTEVEVEFPATADSALLAMSDRRHVTSDLFEVRYGERRGDLLDVLRRWGTPAPERFADLLADLAATFGEVYDVTDGAQVRVDATYLETFRAQRAAEPTQDPRAHLLSVIGRALGLTGPFEEGSADGYDIKVLSGVVDAARDRVAWVERHTFPQDDDDCWVNVWLRVAGDGVRHLPRVQGWVYFAEPGRRITVPLTDGRADRVHQVPFLNFLDEAVVAVFEEGNNTRLCRVTMDAPGLYGVQVDRVMLGGAVTVVDDGDPWDEVALCHLPPYLDEHEALLYTLPLPDLEPRVPIPVPELSSERFRFAELERDADGVRWVEQVPDREVAEPATGSPDRRTVRLRLPGSRQRGFVADPEIVWHRLRTALAGPDLPEDGPDILIGAVATPFWDASGPTPLDGRRRPWRVARGPWWFPTAWYRFQLRPVSEGGAGRPDEAAAWLNWLDRLAAEDRPDGHRGWLPEWSRETGVERFALVHLGRQAKTLAAACRAGGRLPRIGDLRLGQLPATAYPAGFARAWRRLPDRYRPGGEDG